MAMPYIQFQSTLLISSWVITLWWHQQRLKKSVNSMPLLAERYKPWPQQLSRLSRKQRTTRMFCSRWLGKSKRWEVPTLKDWAMSTYTWMEWREYVSPPAASPLWSTAGDRSTSLPLYTTQLVDQQQWLAGVAEEADAGVRSEFHV